MRGRTACIAGALLLASGVAAANPAPAVASSHGASGVGAAQDPSGGGNQPGTFDPDDLKRRLAEAGAALGSAVMIRIFKHESELELWLQKGERFELFAVYPICNWSGSLGPKLAEGDRQSPEGLYSIGVDQLHRTGRWRRSLDIGFPNTHDKAHGRTGSYILVHGGCTSTGCYAMTDKAMEEIFTLAQAALARAQERIQVHAFPFRMTQKNLAAHAQSPWRGFWLRLREAHDHFERTRMPPQVSVCDGQYAVGAPAAEGTEGCVVNVSEASTASVHHRSARRIVRARRTRRSRVARRAVQLRHARRAPGRNARQAYAAARRARMAAQARPSYLGGPKRSRK